MNRGTGHEACACGTCESSIAEEQRREGIRREAFGGFYAPLADEDDETPFTIEWPTGFGDISVEVVDPISEDGTTLNELTSAERMREETQAVRLAPYLNLISRINTETFEDVAQEVFDECFNLLVERQVKYGPKNVEQQGLYGLLVRMRDDKLNRIQRALNGSVVNGQIILDDINLSGEEGDTLEDAYLDLANYAVISLLLLRGRWGRPLARDAGTDD